MQKKEDNQLPEKIYLIGPMGSGKSTIGYKLAKSLNYSYIDLDHEIEKTTGAKIALIFELEKEEGFRRRESQELNKTLDKRKVIVATGGGVILLEENRLFLKKHGFNIYLNANVNTIYKRVKNKKPDLYLRLKTQRMK